MLSQAFKILRRTDLIMLLLMLVLLATGMMFIYGSGIQLGGRFAGYWQRQLFWIACGLVAFAATATVDYRRAAGWSWLLYLAVNGMMVSLFFVGRTVNQATSWLAIGPVTIQPSELAKPVAILFWAWVATRDGFSFTRFRDLCIFAGAVVLPVALVAMQPDWGTALAFLPVGVAMIFIGGLPWRHLLLVVLLSLVVLPVGYRFFLKDYQRQRIQTFLRPSDDALGAGYNARQSLLAVGSGGMFGKGFMGGHQYKLGYLPRNVAPTDFIYAVVGEETGFVGGLMLIAAQLGLIGCCLRTAAMAAEPLGTLLCSGVAALLFVHTYVNIGMTIGAAPIIGIPLPLVSYGGSFMIGIMASLGLVQSVHTRRHERNEI